MAALNTLITFLAVSIVSSSASAVIMEGTFSGQVWEWNTSNMDATSEANFWSDENAFSEFSGSFWFDTELAGQGVVKQDVTSISEVYAGPHNWLHTTLTGANGGSVNVTSSGALATFTSHPEELITVEKYNDGIDAYDRVYLTYTDNNGSANRTGYLTLESKASVLDGLGLIQNFSLPSDEFNSVVGYIGFENSGLLNDVEYHGWMVGGINSAEIHVKVSEPQSLILFLAPLLFLFWRAGLFKSFCRASNDDDSIGDSLKFTG